MSHSVLLRANKGQTVKIAMELFARKIALKWKFKRKGVNSSRKREISRVFPLLFVDLLLIGVSLPCGVHSITPFGGTEEIFVR